MVAAGGVLIEVMADAAVALAPVDERIARALVDELKVSRLLEGVRGQPPANVAALCRAIVRLSVLVDDLRDELDQLDVNPLIVTADGCLAVDALLLARPA